MVTASGPNSLEKRLLKRADKRGFGWHSFPPPLNLFSLLFVLLFILLLNGIHQDKLLDSAQTGHPVSISHQGETLLTVADIKRSMRLPCNYVYDGFYLSGGNAVLLQVYQALQELDDDDVPIIVECGGHDGITKSLSLKSSICLNMNTLLIEASPLNYNILRQSRPFDMTVNAALCDGDFVQMSENKANSGMTKIKNSSSDNSATMVRCTTLDKELDHIRETLPLYQRQKIKLIYLILDVEGHEIVAIKGIHKYPPMKMEMEIKYEHNDSEAKMFLAKWEASNNLTGVIAGDDRRYNWSPTLPRTELKQLLYGARNGHPPIDAATAQVAPYYQFYGE